IQTRTRLRWSRNGSRSATTEMSRTKRPMLSSTHAIFRGLQDHLRQIIRNLPNYAPTRLKRGLLEAHRKLSDYYHKSDESPYHTWAALLDPRISYEGLKRDFTEEPELLAHLKVSVAQMWWWFARRLQFPHLNRFAHNVLCIPGIFVLFYGRGLVLIRSFSSSAVAVERIFSSGRDTISLRCASLPAETIRTLIIVKQHLKLVR
ncbi:hypothetical protein B0H17DRAFT_890972, partial [Mycena rosella]